MSLVFDEKGYAAVAGEIRVYYFDPITREYMGWSDEFINVGVSMPGCSTAIKPGDDAEGRVFIFSETGWVQTEDHRGETAYSISDGRPVTVNYVGALQEGFTFDAPATKFDKWDGNKWVADPEAQRAYDISAAVTRQQALISQANDFMNGKQWPGKAAIGRLKGDELAQYGLWLDYLDALEALDTSSAPDIIWPSPPGQ
ncbi:tail fiber assembly protein [Cronobacter sakazakii SP291]|uniref:tail fiber assembly protein n=1 Tax=Enterobacteriaceae TaxID=543 RepID=UPI0002B2A4F6|nr:tail fiber assembly protein [Cronobacter sakazakii]AGE84950.1 tail fiber assembly protein [Cronobacter sakazakii SP291]HAH3942201.1 tail fiber assembly protein [Escherichia coli]